MNRFHFGSSRLSTVLTLVLLIAATAGGFWLGTRWGHRRDDGPLDPNRVTGLVAVEPPKVAEGAVNVATDFHEWQIELQSQATLLTSNSLLEDMLADMHCPIRSTEWIKKFTVSNGTTSATADSVDIKAARDWLSAHLVARPIKDSHLIAVYLDGPQDDALTIIESVVDRHLQRQETIAAQRVVDRKQLLNIQRQAMESKLQLLTDRRDGIVLKLGIPSGPTVQPSSRPEDELPDLIERRWELEAELNKSNAVAKAATSQSATAVSVNEAQLHDLSAKSAIDAIDQRIERVTREASVPSKAMSKAMEDYLTVNDDIHDQSQKLRDLKAKLDEPDVFSAGWSVNWARHPEATGAR